jgi:hypothetical protein
MTLLPASLELAIIASTAAVKNIYLDEVMDQVSALSS